MMKSIVGDGAGGLVHTIWLDLGPDQCCLFMTQAQRIVNNWLVMSGATISCSDIVPPAAVDRKI
jgi:DNA-directed RNA polymerase II subunit RPB1